MNNGQVPTEQTGIFKHTSTMLFTMGRALHVAVKTIVKYTALVLSFYTTGVGWYTEGQKKKSLFALTEGKN